MDHDRVHENETQHNPKTHAVSDHSNNKNRTRQQTASINTNPRLNIAWGTTSTVTTSTTSPETSLSPTRSNKAKILRRIAFHTNSKTQNRRRSCNNMTSTRCTGDKLVQSRHTQTPCRRDRFHIGNWRFSTERKRRQGRQTQRWEDDLNNYLNKKHNSERAQVAMTTISRTTSIPCRKTVSNRVAWTNMEDGFSHATTYPHADDITEIPE